MLETSGSNPDGSIMKLSSTAKLNNGVEIPLLGLGTYKSTPGNETEQAIKWALELGYRHIDTAARYGNEEDVGKGVRKSGVPREEIFVTTKLWNDDQIDPVKAFNISMKKFGLEYVDLYLMHFPVRGLRNKTWKIMESMLKEGKCRAIGVSNFTIRHLEELLKITDVVPVVNQVEFHPYLFQKELMDFCKKRKIFIQAYGPFAKCQKFDDQRLVALAEKYKKTPAHIMVRWSLQHGNIVLPKSVHREHILENSNVFDFEISKVDMAEIDSFNENLRLYWDSTNEP